MKFRYTIWSSLGHEVYSKQIDVNIETLQNYFKESYIEFIALNRKELGENEFLYLEYDSKDKNKLETRLYDVFVEYYNLYT